MKLGIMSDSHGRAHVVRQARILLEWAGAEAIVHCGDVGSLDVLDELSGCPCWFVWGNMDDPAPAWRGHVEALGLPWPNGPLELHLAGKRLIVFHGHEPGFSRAMRTATYHYLLYGHTHESDDQRIAAMRVINPGALCRTATETVALLDLNDDSLQFLDVQATHV